MSYDGWDDDLPRGFSDADIEQASYEAEGNRLAALRKAGICTHGWQQGHADGSVDCLEDGCGAHFPSQEAADAAREEALG